MRIDLYPIKSLDGVSVDEAIVLASGALQGDREYALVDDQGRYVNGKRTAKIHQLRSQFQLNSHCITIQDANARAADLMAPIAFDLHSESSAFETWMSHYLSLPIQLKQNTIQGFPDDTNSPGPTLVSTATLQCVADWFGLSLGEVRSRFRTNLEIDGVPAFWEDQLFGAAGEAVPFRIGEVQVLGINPCLRCPVPTRNPLTGEVTPQFVKRFVEYRQQQFPTWANRDRFDNFYRLTINTQIPASEAGKTLRVGDRLGTRIY